MHTHTHNVFSLCLSLSPESWRLFFVSCHWTSVLHIVQFIFNCYCHCCRIYNKLNERVCAAQKLWEWWIQERISERLRKNEKYNFSLHRCGLCNCLTQIHVNFSIFALIFSSVISAQHNYIHEPGETNLIYCHYTSTTNCDEQCMWVWMCIWQQSAALLHFIQRQVDE